MEQISFNYLKTSLFGSFGAFGAFIINLLGGWDGAMAMLALFMTIDYISGFLVAALFKKSNKTENGALESKAGFKGLCRKGMVLFYILIAKKLDLFLGLDYIRYIVILGFALNELVSITENSGLMGVPVPKKIVEAIEVLKDKAGK